MTVEKFKIGDDLIGIVDACWCGRVPILKDCRPDSYTIKCPSNCKDMIIKGQSIEEIIEKWRNL